MKIARFESGSTVYFALLVDSNCEAIRIGFNLGDGPY
jgi:hypothetical protein